MINLYKDIFNKINDKILRPIFFKDAQDMYDFLSSFIIGGGSRYFRITQYSDDRNISGLIFNIDGWNPGYVQMELENNPHFRIPSDNNSVRCYTNKDRSIFVCVPAESIYNHRCALVIK